MRRPIPNLDLRKLRYFVQVAESRSMSRAAAQLHVAQPALSKSIRALEDELEKPLFQRSAQGVIPTDAGKRLYEHCQIIFQQVERACLEVRKSGQKSLAHVAIGMPFSVATVLALPLLQATTLQLPDIRLELLQDHSHQLPAQVRSGRVDFAIMARPRTQAGLTIRNLVLEELFYVDRADEAAAEKSSPVSFMEAAERSYVLPSIGNGLRSAAESYFRTHSLQLDVAHEIDAVGLIPRCVAAGLGASLLPGGFVQRDSCFGQFVVRPFDSGCDRLIVLCQSAKTSAAPAQAVITLLERLTAELVATGQWLGARHA